MPESHAEYPIDMTDEGEAEKTVSWVYNRYDERYALMPLNDVLLRLLSVVQSN